MNYISLFFIPSPYNWKKNSKINKREMFFLLTTSIVRYFIIPIFIFSLEKNGIDILEFEIKGGKPYLSGGLLI
jgi:hypothetical protein